MNISAAQTKVMFMSDLNIFYCSSFCFFLISLFIALKLQYVKYFQNALRNSLFEAKKE